MDIDKFKQCPKCNHWFSAKEIMQSQEVVPLGMTFEDHDIQNNVYFFNHAVDDCNTTFTISVMEFQPFMPTTPINEILTGCDECELHCVDINDLATCNAPCHYAPFRKFLIAMIEKKRQKIEC